MWIKCGHILADFEYKDVFAFLHQVWETTYNIVFLVVEIGYKKCNYKLNNIPIRCHNCNQIRNTIGHPGANCIEKENTMHTK